MEIEKTQQSVGIKVIAWMVITANAVLACLLMVPLPVRDVPMVQRALPFVATVAVFPLDFYQAYLGGEWQAQLGWIMIVLASAVGILFYKQVARMTFIVLNVIHVVIMIFLVAMRLDAGVMVFLKMFFRLYFNMVAFGSYVGFLTLGEMREQFSSGLTWPAASLWFKKLRTRTPVLRDADAHFNLGLAYRRLGRLEDAALNLENAVRISPRTAAYHYELGLTYVQSGRSDQAIPRLQEAVRLDPLHASAHVALGQAFLTQGCSAEAVQELRRASHVRDQDPQVFFLLGQALAAAQRPSEALEAFQRAVERRVSSSTAYAAMGRIYLETMEDYPKAQEAFRQAVRLDPRDAGACYGLGLASLKLSRYKDAIRAFKDLLRLDPDHRQGHYQLGFSYAMIEDFDSAKREWRYLAQVDEDLAATLRMVIK